MLTDLTYIREYHSFGTSKPKDSFLEIHIKRAKKKLIKMVGEAAYLDAESATPTNISRAEDLKDAEAELVMWSGIAKLNLKINNVGIVQSSKSKSAGDGNYTIATPEQIKKLKASYLQSAEDIVSDHMPQISGPVAVKAE